MPVVRRSAALEALLEHQVPALWQAALWQNDSRSLVSTILDVRPMRPGRVNVGVSEAKSLFGGGRRIHRRRNAAELIGPTWLRIPANLVRSFELTQNDPGSS